MPELTASGEQTWRNAVPDCTWLPPQTPIKKSIFPWVMSIRLRKAQVERIAWLEDQLWEEIAKRPVLTIATFNYKGGSGKTELTVWLATVIANIGRGVVTVVDTENGRAFERLGIYEPTTHRRVLENMSFMAKYRCSVGLFPRTRYGVRVVASDEINVAMKQELLLSDYESIYRAIQNNSNVVLIDTGNDPHEAGNQAAINSCDVAIFACWKHQQDSSVSASETAQAYRLTHPDKVNESSLGVYMGGSVEELLPYSEALGFTSQYATFVPQDDYVQGTNVVNLEKLSPDAYEALLTTAIAVYHRAKRPKQTATEITPPPVHASAPEPPELSDLPAPNPTGRIAPDYERNPQ